MAEALDRFIARIESHGCKWKKQGGWLRAQHPCSSGSDEGLSLAFREDPDGKLTVVSHKPTHPVEEVLRVLGLEWKDLYPNRDDRHLGSFNQKRIIARYEYTDKAGNPVGAVQRTEDKQFPQGHYEGAKLKPGLNGKPLPIYRLPAVLGALSEGKPIYITEGEKDANALWQIGTAATTLPGGAKAAKQGWIPERANIFKGADVVIVADKDAAGAEAAEDTYRALLKIAGSICVVEAKEGKDAFDHIAAGFKPIHFVARPDLHAGPGLRLISFVKDDFDMVDIEFLIEPYFPRGKGILLDADGGTGKTSWLISIFAALSHGMSPVGTFRGNGPVKSLLIYADSDRPEEYETIYRSNGGKPGYFSMFNSARFFDQEFADDIEATIIRESIGIWAMDPFFYFLLGIVESTNDPMQAMEVIKRANAIAERTNTVFVPIRHTGKATLGKAASDLGLGTVQWRNGFRGQLVMRWHPEEPGVVVVEDWKGGPLVPKGPPFQFRRCGQYGEIQYILNGKPAFGSKDAGKQKEIEEWLQMNVSWTTWNDSADVEERATRAGYNVGSGSYRDAKKLICVSKKFGPKWCTKLRDEYGRGDEYDPWENDDA